MQLNSAWLDGSDLGSEAHWLGFWLEDLDLGLAWSDHGSMARSWLSGSEARILTDLARDLSSVAQRLNSISAHEDRIKKLYPQIFFFFF
jgi:hypothetical protein